MVRARRRRRISTGFCDRSHGCQRDNPLGRCLRSLGPAQTLAEAGSRLLTQLQGWLTNAESFLTTIGSDEEVGEARTGLAGLIDQAKEVTSDMEAAIADVLTMPLQALIALAKVVLSAVQSSVEAAQNVMASIDAARCN